MSTIKKEPGGDLYFWSLIIAIIILLAMMMLNSCESHEQTISTQPFDPYEHSIDYTEPIVEAAAMFTPCDSTYYEPVAFGAELRVLKNTISKGNRRGLLYWQCKSFAWQLIVPTKYQQDSTKERVVFADIDTIGYSDIFYICRKKHL